MTMTSCLIKILCITSLSAFIYCPTLDGDFVFDDSEAIVKNSDVVGHEPLSELFSHDFWGSNVTSNYSHKSYRPLTVFTFRLNYNLNGNKLNALHFKLTNLVCHIICCLLAWQTYRMLTKDNGRWNDVGFLSALLFGAHPVHVEAVAGIVGRADLLACIFYFIAFISYIKATTTKKSAWSKYVYLLLSLIFSGLSMISKEIGVTVLGVCLTYEITYIRRLDIIDLFLKTNSKTTKVRKIKTKNRNSLIRIITLLLGSLCLLLIRWAVMGNTRPQFQETDNPAAFSEDIITRVLSYQYIYFLNILLLVWPHWLCFDWSMGCVRLVESPFDPRVFCIISLYLYAMHLIKFVFDPNIKLKQKRLIVISIGMMVIPFLPATNLLLVVGFVLAERLLYIPSAGYCLLLVTGFTKLAHASSRRYYKILYTLYFMLLLCLSWKSWQRSRDWRNEHELFSSGLSVCPNNAKVHYNVAKSAAARHQIPEAIEEYKKAIRLHPKYYQAMNNLANLLKDQKKFREAENYLREAIKHKGDFAAAWMNLGIVLASTRRRREARDAYLFALAHRRTYPDCHYNLANLYLEMDLPELAAESWSAAIAASPRHRLAWSNLLAMLDNTGQTQRALELVPRALSELEDAPSIHFIAANILGKIDQFEQAEEHFLKTIELAGNSVQAIHYANLGVLYHRWKRYLRAEESYQKALNINPTLKSALDNISTVRKIIEKQKINS